MPIQDPNTDPTQQVADSPGLLSVERIVTFFLGPIVLAVAGFLSIEAGRLAGVSLSQELVAGIGMSGVLGATALIYKWLDGRSKHTLAKLDIAHTRIVHLLETAGVSSPAQAGFVKLALADLEHVAEHASQSAVNLIHDHLGALVDTKLDDRVHSLLSSDALVSGQAATDPPAPAVPAPPPIPAAGNDPAPATPVAQGAAPVADAGAASSQ